MIDVFVIIYGSKWGIKFTNSIVQKIYKTKEEAVFYGRQLANQKECDLYLEVKPGKFEKVKPEKKL